MQEWIIAMLVVSILLILRDMAKTVFSGRCLRVAVWNLLQSFGNWRKYDFSGCAEYCYRALQRKSD
mgnify:CR=1 FL=1